MIHMLSKFFRLIRTHSLFLPPILLMGVFIILLQIIFQIQSEGAARLSREDGLAPIKIIQVVNGKEQELNITDTTFEILKEAISSNNRFDTTTEEKIRQVQIKDIVFPPIPEDQIQVVDKSDKESIEKYLTDVYTVFMNHKITFVVDDLIRQSLASEHKNIKDLINTNTDLYNSLFEIPVPSAVLPLHRKYIQIAQIQNHFFQNLLTGKADPLKIQIDLNLALSLLSKLNEPIRQDLKNLSNTYNLEYNVDI